MCCDMVWCDVLWVYVGHAIHNIIFEVCKVHCMQTLIKTCIGPRYITSQHVVLVHNAWHHITRIVLHSVHTYVTASHRLTSRMRRHIDYIYGPTLDTLQDLQHTQTHSMHTYMHPYIHTSITCVRACTAYIHTHITYRCTWTHRYTHASHACTHRITLHRCMRYVKVSQHKS